MFSDSCFSGAQTAKISLELSLLPHSTTTLFWMRAANADVLSLLQFDASNYNDA